MCNTQLLFYREREFIMFGNVQRIILFHRKVFTTGLNEADGQAEKVKDYMPQEYFLDLSNI